MNSKVHTKAHGPLAKVQIRLRNFSHCLISM